MSGPVTTRVWRESLQAKVKPMHGKVNLLVLVKIADNVNDDGYGWAGNTYLAENCHLTERQIQRLVDELQDSGELYVRPGNGRGQKNATLITVGLDHPTIKSRLVRYFEMSPLDAENV